MNFKKITVFTVFTIILLIGVCGFAQSNDEIFYGCSPSAIINNFGEPTMISEGDLVYKTDDSFLEVYIIRKNKFVRYTVIRYGHLYKFKGYIDTIKQREDEQYVNRWYDQLNGESVMYFLKGDVARVFTYNFKKKRLVEEQFEATPEYIKSFRGLQKIRNK